MTNYVCPHIAISQSGGTYASCDKQALYLKPFYLFMKCNNCPYCTDYFHLKAISVLAYNPPSFS